ncbi:MAG TPA: hypothetical protein VGN04_07290 [Herbaspirillum sp.]|jgi:hypothetical protein
MPRFPHLVFLAFLLATLSACDKSSATKEPANESATESAPAVAQNKNPDEIPRRTGNRTYTSLDLSWNSLPKEDYEKMYGQFRNLYWSGTPKDLDKLAEDFSVDYRRETDSFKRSDLLKQLTPALEKNYSDAQLQKDYSIRPLQSSAHVSPYDAKLGRYRVTFSSDAEEYRLKKDDDIHKNNSEWHILFLGIPTPDATNEIYYKPKDEAEARLIESSLSRRRSNGNDEAYTPVQFEGAVIGNLHENMVDTALFGIDNIIVLDKDTGRPLFKIPSGDLGPMHIAKTKIRQALKLPALPSGTQQSYF